MRLLLEVIFVGALIYIGLGNSVPRPIPCEHQRHSEVIERQCGLAPNCNATAATAPVTNCKIDIHSLSCLDVGPKSPFSVGWTDSETQAVVV